MSRVELGLPGRLRRDQLVGERHDPIGRPGDVEPLTRQPPRCGRSRSDRRAKPALPCQGSKLATVVDIGHLLHAVVVHAMPGGPARPASLSCGSRTRTCVLRLMRPASTPLLHPAAAWPTKKAARVCGPARPSSSLARLSARGDQPRTAGRPRPACPRPTRSPPHDSKRGAPFGEKRSISGHLHQHVTATAVPASCPPTS